VLENLVLLTAVIQALTFVRLVRRPDLAQRGYLLVILGGFVLAVIAMLREDRFLGVIAMGMCVLTVVIPWMVDVLARRAFSAGRAAMAVRLAGIRATLMPGAGLSRQRELLRGLALLELQGVDAALAHLQRLAGQTEDGNELALIHEQIISMLFYGQRWDEGIAHYEGRFHPGYAAMRPTLAVGLVRAYGESGKLGTAAEMLRALEEGPMGSEPRAAPLLSQARLTFLAFAGVSNVVNEAASEKSCRALGLSPASGALFHGIALARSGQRERAQTELRRVEEVAGPRDDRTVAASHDAISRLGEAAVELGPELTRYAQAVAERLRSFLERGPGIRHHETPWATPGLMVALALGYAAALLADRGGIGLLEVGALTPELWRAGSWGRLLTGSFVQADLIALLLNMYGLWLGGSVVERAVGPVRLALLALASGAVGLALAAGMVPDVSAPLAGGNLLSFGVTMAAFWLLLTGRTPGLSRRVRRGLAIPLGLVLVAHVLASVARGDAMDVPAVGLAGAFGVAVVFVGLLPSRTAPWLSRLLRWTLVAALGVTAAALVDVAAEDVEGFALAHRDQRIEHEGVRFRVPSNFSRREAGTRDSAIIPAKTGLFDELEARTGALVQILVLRTDPADDAKTRDGPVLFVADPKLERELGASELRELPTALLAAFGPNPPLRAFALRRNGATVAQVVERTMSPGLTVVLVAAPAEALTHAPGLYGEILADAAAVKP